MDKKKKTLSRKTARMRGWIQAAATLLTNIHIPNLFKGKIYQGKAKTVCVPGLNCYSCPAATGACPIGAFQAVVGSSKFKFTYYITDFFILLGVLLGRFICGFLCPFGWFQDLLHKIPGKKFSTARLKPLRYLKYIILIVFVILLPMLVTNSIGMGGEVIGINTETFDGNETAIKEAAAVLESQGAKYRNLSIDASSDAGKYASDIMAFPTTILVDRNGNIVGDPMLGGIDNQDNYDTLMKQIQSVIDADSANK